MRALLLFLTMLAACLPVRLIAAGGVPSLPLCFGEAATIVGGDLGGTISGTGGRDVIYAADGAIQTIRALGGDDVICVGGLDTVYAGSGNDRVEALIATAIYGESGNDSITGFGSKLISGGSGDDILAGSDLLVRGDSGNDAFTGYGAVHCDGGSGTDSAIIFACNSTTSIP